MFTLLLTCKILQDAISTNKIKLSVLFLKRSFHKISAKFAISLKNLDLDSKPCATKITIAETWCLDDAVDYSLDEFLNNFSVHQARENVNEGDCTAVFLHEALKLMTFQSYDQNFKNILIKHTVSGGVVSASAKLRHSWGFRPNGRSQIICK